MDVTVVVVAQFQTEGWAPKNWCFQTVVLEKTLERPLDCKIKLVNLKGNQPWIFIGRTDAEAEVPILWSPDAKSWLIGKDPDSGKDWRQKEKGVTEGEMVKWHHWLSGYEFEQTLWDSEDQGSLAGAVHQVAKNQTRLSNWATTTSKPMKFRSCFHISFGTLTTCCAGTVQGADESEVNTIDMVSKELGGDLVAVMSNSCDPMDCSLPGSSVHGILQARILEWVSISFSRGSSQPRNWTWVSCIAGRFFTDWAMRKAPSKGLKGCKIREDWQVRANHISSCRPCDKEIKIPSQLEIWFLILVQN